MSPHAPSVAGVDESAESSEKDDREPGWLTQASLFIVVAIQGADMKLLSSSMKALQQDIGVTLTDIGYMAMAQMITTTGAAPLWGILADRGTLTRRTILVAACLGQGLVTMLLALVSDMASMVLLRMLNGMLLAALRPIANGIIADATTENKQGRIFGRVTSGFLLGMLATTVTVVPVATEEVMGFHGWRVAWVVVGLISVLVAGVVFCCLEEPPCKPATTTLPQGCAAVGAELKTLWSFFTVLTFCVLVVKGVFEAIPHTVFGNLILFLQLAGVDNGKVVAVMTAHFLAAAAGVGLGGRVGDCLAGRIGVGGRPLTSQLSLAFNVPLTCGMLLGGAPNSGNFWLYLVLVTLRGLLGTWTNCGTNYPIVTHIVPALSRTRVMAWGTAIEDSIAAAVGPILLAQLAERAFGYDFGAAKGRRPRSAADDISSAEALGKALATTICIPMILAFALTSLLYWSYPRDIRKLQQQQQQEQELTDKEPSAGVA
mmetsp:Transcript_93938/g.236695  ORF Transcript_93938/g.236695 Transcript_93938/m.236695 type:complete len:487 (+) Transcript_93938:61-1521(+)